MSDKTPDQMYEEVTKLRELYEPLRQDLRTYLEETKFGYFIRHPFCNMPVVDLDHCALVHQIIDDRVAEADTCFERQDWEGYISCVEVCFQPEWFAKDCDELPDEAYWRVLASVYKQQRTTFSRRDLFEQFFRSGRPGRENLMTPEEREVFARLPDVLTVYRGYADDAEGYDEGIAWTLDRRQAVWYANRNRKADDPFVITGKVRKADVWAYHDGGDLLLPSEKVFRKQCHPAWCDEARVDWTSYIKKPFDIVKIIGRK
jgi:hypothetical protein